MSDKLQNVLDILNDAERDDVNEWWGDESKGKTAEEELRDEFPSLQNAWEQYQTVLKLCKESKPKKEEQSADEILAGIRARQAARDSTGPRINPKVAIGSADDILKNIRSKK